MQFVQYLANIYVRMLTIIKYKNCAKNTNIYFFMTTKPIKNRLHINYLFFFNISGYTIESYKNKYSSYLITKKICKYVIGHLQMQLYIYNAQ